MRILNSTIRGESHQFLREEQNEGELFEVGLEVVRTNLYKHRTPLGCHGRYAARFIRVAEQSSRLPSSPAWPECSLRQTQPQPA